MNIANASQCNRSITSNIPQSLVSTPYLQWQAIISPRFHVTNLSKGTVFHLLGCCLERLRRGSYWLAWSCGHTDPWLVAIANIILLYSKWRDCLTGWHGWQATVICALKCDGSWVVLGEEGVLGCFTFLISLIDIINKKTDPVCIPASCGKKRMPIGLHPLVGGWSIRPPGAAISLCMCTV